MRWMTWWVMDLADMYRYCFSCHLMPLNTRDKGSEYWQYIVQPVSR